MQPIALMKFCGVHDRSGREPDDIVEATARSETLETLYPSTDPYIV